jgi:hypothetical protein
MNPQFKDLQVVTASDDEGNYYNLVEMNLQRDSVGNFECGEFIYIDDFEDYELEPSDINSVCVN